MTDITTTATDLLDFLAGCTPAGNAAIPNAETAAAHTLAVLIRVRDTAWGEGFQAGLLDGSKS